MQQRHPDPLPTRIVFIPTPGAGPAIRAVVVGEFGDDNSKSLAEFCDGTSSVLVVPERTSLEWLD